MVGKIPVIVKLKDQLSVKGKGGETLYGFLLSSIAEVDEEFASYLHNFRGIKPISISPIFPLSSNFEVRNGRMYLKDKSEFKFIVNSLNMQTTEVLIKTLANVERKKTMKIGNAKCTIKKICLKENEGGVFVKYKDMLTHNEERRQVDVKIISPLSFRKNGKQIIFPEPYLFFNSLMKIFNSFSNVKIPSILENRFQEIEVNKFSLRSEMWEFSKYKIIGCIGYVGFRFGNRFNEEEVKFLNTLCRFANFSGVGYKRTMGMGMVEVK